MENTTTIEKFELNKLKPINQSSIRNELIGLVSDNSPEYENFLKSILDQNKEYPPPIPVINLIQGEQSLPLLTLKSFSLWQGKQKSKKTTALAIAISAFIGSTGNNSGICFEAGLKGKVLWFDCEQGESYAARTMKLILSLAGLKTSNKLIYCDLREFSPNDRINIIKAAIKNTEDVKLVVIDGLVDLLSDFMDSTEGHNLTTEILQLSSQFNLHIAGILHQNKNDKNARAHIGTISSQKCEVEISTEVDPNDRNQSQVSCINSRGLPFETFSIRWDKGSLPCINQEWNSIEAKDTRASKNYDRSKEIAEAVFKPLLSLTHSEAIKGIMKASNKSESTAKRLLKDFQGWDFISKCGDGNYRINNKMGSQVQKGSNGVHEPVHI